MDTDPAARTVLCFGDSNTYGQRAEHAELGRLPADQRWTGVSQCVLGGRYYLIEEGLNGRTTDLDDPADGPGRNGRTYLTPCLLSHDPLDVVVIMLGTNDLKVGRNRSAADVAAALGRLLDDVAAHARTRAGDVSRTVLVSPIHVDDTAPEFGSGSFDSTSAASSRQLGTEIALLATTRGVLFADAATVARAGADGIHLTVDSHRALGELLAAWIGEVPALAG